VLVLGVPLLLALRPQHLVALLGHEIGHLKHDDNARVQLTQPARSTFGRLSGMVRPGRVESLEFSLFGLPVLMWQLVTGTLAALLWLVHLGMNALAGGDDRRVELRADAAAAQVAGTAAALEMLDVMAMMPELTKYVQHHVPEGKAAAKWRAFLTDVRERESGVASAWRQLSARTEASHPAPGRRHQWLARQTAQAAAVMIDQAEAGRIEKRGFPVRRGDAPDDAPGGVGVTV
jgi:heat shock protein HtpX